MRLSGKVAVVTGASRGLGRAIAERFAAEGARLVLNYRQDASSMEAAAAACLGAGAEVELVQGDVGSPETPERLCQRACDRFGTIDVLVNNAGIAREDLLVLLPDGELEAMISTNVTGLVRLSRAAAGRMIRRRAGAIVNLSSVLARRPGRGNAVYAGTKGFVESFTRALALELGPKGIRVNAIAPGLMETALSGAVRAVAGPELRERVALRRFGAPAEVAGAALFLASDDASYVNGAVLEVDGGFTGGM
jgi:3-oxoacyl-[acyl-carrier protein] reductase